MTTKASPLMVRKVEQLDRHTLGIEWIDEWSGLNESINSALTGHGIELAGIQAPLSTGIRDVSDIRADGHNGAG